MRYTHTQVVASLPTSRQQAVLALLVPSYQQVWNNLLTVVNNLVDIIRLVARLFQQVRYSHDKTILLQPCVVNLVTFLYIMTVSDLLEQLCNKSDNAIKFLPNLLQQIGTQLVDNIVNTQYKTLNNNVTVTSKTH
jgi:phage-related protein